MAVEYRRFEDLGELARYLDSCADHVNPVTARATNDTAHGLLANTIPVTPIEFGPLRASGRVTQPSLMGSDISVDIVFGGAAAGYAIYVHERVVNRATGKRIFHLAPTKAKFLSDTATDTFPMMQAEMFVRSVAIFTETR